VLTKTNLYGADLSTADLSMADLRNSDMTGANIQKADFNFSKMSGSIGTNGQPWGTTHKKSTVKRPWWQLWGRSAAM
jgi:uncharacterized protein YjbI with pentapeptide repeats